MEVWKGVGCRSWGLAVVPEFEVLLTVACRTQTYGRACCCDVEVWIRGCCAHGMASLLVHEVLLDHPMGCPSSSGYLTVDHAVVEVHWEGSLA